MQINWSVRLRNKAWLASALALAVAFAFDVLTLLDVAPAITQDSVMQGVNALLTILAGLGVIIDPTTPGVSDSERAMLYVAPGQFDTEPPDGQ